MASIFTFDPDPPRVSSPWATPPPGARPTHTIPQDLASHSARVGQGPTTHADSVDYRAIARLEPEPQEGPTEYKLHLLLRKRRSFTYASTGKHVSGSLRRADPPTTSVISRSVSESGLLSATPPQASATESRQHRLEQLTTQLRWRLKQSCSIHIPSNTTHVLPLFPEIAQLSAPTAPQRLPPDLEDTKGALYEIGVADDGTFVGLAEDEMEESLDNLRAMAKSLGCIVTIQRMVQVGECGWIEEIAHEGAPQKHVRTGKLWVAEALVRPGQQLADLDLARSSDMTEQVRVSLTGATGSGKSSLLGSLTTATLDNGRGSSRLSLLRHRHEIASGMTSSVTQELIGYRDDLDRDGTRSTSQVINYGAGDVSSWVEIHAKAEGGRLVLLSDSAGHLRYRRTTVRGLVGWDPHWTLLCIPADNTDESSGRMGASPATQDLLGSGGVEMDLSQVHLQLCLNLELPLVLLITKYDLATKAGLKFALSKLLSAIKGAGRTPYIIRKPSTTASETGLNTVTVDNFSEVEELARELQPDPLRIVPILLTSCVNGTGVNTLHALLRELPLSGTPATFPASSCGLFYIEDVYNNVSAASRHTSITDSSDRSIVIGGHLRSGTVQVGDELLLGPYPIDAGGDDSDTGSGRGSTPPTLSTRASPVPTSRSFPGALNKDQSGHSLLGSRSYGGDRHAEWRRIRITSLRNLRLPVQRLRAGQAGTIGVVPLDLPISTPAVVRIRKGMVVTDGDPKANRVIQVRFSGNNAEGARSLGVGMAVVIYVASVRASAKVLSVAPGPRAGETSPHVTEFDEIDEIDTFGLGFDGDNDVGVDASVEFSASTSTVVSFQFIASREFIEHGAKVLVLPGGGPGLYGVTERGEKGMAALEGFVGRVVEKY